MDKPERHALLVVEKQLNQCCMLVERLAPLCIHRTKAIMLESRDIGEKCREVEVGVGWVVRYITHHIIMAGATLDRQHL